MQIALSLYRPSACAEQFPRTFEKQSRVRLVGVEVTHAHLVVVDLGRSVDVDGREELLRFGPGNMRLLRWPQRERDKQVNNCASS